MRHKLPGGLYALVDDSICAPETMAPVALALLEAQVPTIQLRFKRTGDRDAVEIVRTVVAGAQASGAQIIVNDRVDLALVGGAQGVHLGASDLPIDVARKVLGTKALLGATVRTLEHIEQAHTLGADYVGLGPIFTTTTKQVEHAPLGLSLLRSIASQSPLPVVAIGGISIETIGAVAAAGAAAAAVAGGLLRADDLKARARALHQAFLAHAL